MTFARGAYLLASLMMAGSSDPFLQEGVRISMRDGIRLSANLFRPAKSGRYSTLLIRTPYGKGDGLLPGYKPFLDAGFVVLIQDVRGRYGSEGSFRPLTQERPDGQDTLRWIVRQPWSDGSIGMLAGSYLGTVQWQAALSEDPHLRAIFPIVAGNDEYRDRFYSRGGAMKLGHRLTWLADNLRTPNTAVRPLQSYIWHLPLRTIDGAATGRRLEVWQEALNHPAYDEFWRARSTRQQIGKVHAPAFIVGGWYDNYAESDLDAFTLVSRNSAVNRIVIGPWPHNMTGPFESVDFGPESGAPIRRYQLNWFQYWLRTPQPAPEFPMAPVRIFVMGANKWRDEREWPLRRTRYTPWYLSSRNGANSLRGDGALLSDPRTPDKDEFTYDPKRPAPTHGGAVCCNPKAIAWGPLDQRRVEERDDVLVYTSAPLRQDLEVTGPVRAVLFVSTSARDTDFTAKLVDVFPDGQARNLCDGILRLRYRESLERPALAKPGEIYEITVEAGVTSNVFKAGHRVRLEVSSSNFPRFDRNPNTGRPLADETELRTARQTVYHGHSYPSYMLLPVVP